MWKLIPQATTMLINKIKEKSLRIYLTTYATSFSAISIRTLADRFELPIKEIYGIISKMIINQELMVIKYFLNRMNVELFSLGFD